MDDYFWIDGVRCDEYGINLQGPVEFDAPTPRISTTSVPGRNGDLIFFDGSYSNVSGVAKCFSLKKNVYLTLHGISKWTLLNPGYHRLETSDDPESFRIVRIVNGPQTQVRVKLLAPFEINFDCKPQKFLKNGEEIISISKNDFVVTNFYFPSFPLITVYGSGAGELNINDKNVTFYNIDDYIILDSDTQNAYKGLENKNNEINAPEFPTFKSGDNTVHFSGGITRLEIVPRWYTL